MLLGSSIRLPNSIMSHLFSIPYTGPQLKKESISNSFHSALNLWMVLPLPTSQIFFTFTLLLGSSVLLQTPECSDYPSVCIKSSGQRFFSYQAPTTWTNLPASLRHASSVSCFRSSLKTFLFSKTFSSVPLPWGACVCQGVCLCVYVCVCACECGCVCLLFRYFNYFMSKHTYMC